MIRVCGCINPEPEEKIIIMYNKNPHGKAEIGVTEAMMVKNEKV